MTPSSPQLSFNPVFWTQGPDGVWRINGMAARGGSGVLQELERMLKEGATIETVDMRGDFTAPAGNSR